MKPRCSSKLFSPTRANSCGLRYHVFILTLGLLVGVISSEKAVEDTKAPSNVAHSQTPDIFIDVDEPAPGSLQTKAGNPPKKGKTDLHLRVGQGHITLSAEPKGGNSNDIFVDDDESFLASGSGSGSGDYEVYIGPDDATDAITPTTSKVQTNETVLEVGLEPSQPHVDLEIQGGDEVDTEIPAEPQAQPADEAKLDNTLEAKLEAIPEAKKEARSGYVLGEEDDNETGDLYEEDLDAIYDLPGTSPVTSNHVITPATWAKWSTWFTVGHSTRVRVRTCQVDGRDVSEEACQGIRLQMKTCTDLSTDQCGRVENISTPVSSLAEDQQYRLVKASPPVAPKPPSPDLCQYSLYDAHRHKYVFTRWNLTELITRSKVKKWCDQSSGQYIVMATPMDHCRGYYRDLCKVSQKCRASKPPRERGDFAEGCWRSHVYGDMLPIGLSNKQTIIYFICQRFAQESALGKTFGSKHTHFGTLYDTTLKAPVVSLAKISRLGDETWPETEYLVEHGLVESESSLLWFSRRPKKGMLSLGDLERCPDDQSCAMGQRQVLPQDYKTEPNIRDFQPAHLIWPELMPPEPAPRIATFTMTNTAPLHKAIFQEWHDKVRQVRQFAIEQCGVPVVLNPDFRYQTVFSNHRVKKSNLYVASGVSPSFNSEEPANRDDVWVPFMFWMAGCCVQKRDGPVNLTKEAGSNSVVGGANDVVYGSVDESKMSHSVNITSFAVYVRNQPDSHVISAPVLQLELLLQDIYRATPTDPDVTLFPGHEGACSQLEGDVSRWFHK